VAGVASATVANVASSESSESILRERIRADCTGSHHRAVCVREARVHRAEWIGSLTRRDRDRAPLDYVSLCLIIIILMK